jgi:hypothetical protein
VGACAGVVLARTMVRDLYEGERAAQMMSKLMTVMATLAGTDSRRTDFGAGWLAGDLLDAGRRRSSDARGVVHAARDADGRAA